jgi:hypothetical protein
MADGYGKYPDSPQNGSIGFPEDRASAIPQDHSSFIQQYESRDSQLDGAGDFSQYGARDSQQDEDGTFPQYGARDSQQDEDGAFPQYGVQDYEKAETGDLQPAGAGDFERLAPGDFQPNRGSQISASSERARWPPLTRMLMAGETNGEPSRELTLKEKFDVWMVNEGFRRLFVAVFAVLHLMIFIFAFINFQLKDNLTGARDTFELGYPIARSAALVLHVDVSLLLFRECNLLSALIRADGDSCLPHTHLFG